MEVHFTARRFRAQKDVRDHAIAMVKRLDKFYDGIVRCDVILSFVRPVQSVKTVEVILHVYGAKLTATEKSDDFYKSIDLAVGKLERQLAKYKTKRRSKDKSTIRRVKHEASSAEEAGGETE